MYFISSIYNEMLDAQAHEQDNPQIIKHAIKELYALKISKENVSKGMKIVETLPKDWGC